MKFKYKVLIVFAVFIAALIYFGGDIRKSFFETSAATTQMSSATLPTICFDVNGSKINRLHGYVSNLDEMIMRETITPVTSARTFTVLIEENESTVKKLKYEVLNMDGREVESDSFTVLEAEDGPKKVRITLKETMKTGQEYICKITLITNKSKRIYYYTRLKMYDDGYLDEKLDFAQSFSSILFSDSDTAKQGLKKYLESSRSADNTSFARVTIKSSFFMVTWGNLEPRVIWEETPTINEFYDSMASIELKYLISIDQESGTEYYVVKEHFRFTYTEKRTYLYTYDRTMEAVFDVENTSLIRNEFKLGITNETDAQTGASDSRKYLSFVYGRELMLYDVDRNILHKVFSFRENNGDYSRDYYDQHAIRLIHVYDNGDVDFMVYGYMNRGEYEGRVGIVLYRFILEDERIEEQMYIAVNSSYQLLAADMTDFAYLGDRNIFYFSLYDSIYAFDLTTKKLSVIAEGVPAENLVYCEEEEYIAWQDDEDDMKARVITVMSLTDGTIRRIEAGYGENIRIYGRINNNIIYGMARKDDISTLVDGSRILPAYKLFIEEGSGNILKVYEEKDLCVRDVEIRENMIVLKRLRRKLGNPVIYEEAPDDSIMNRHEDIEQPVSVTKRVTDKILTEYYVSLPKVVDIGVKPTLVYALSTIINYDTTTRVYEPENRTGQFYTYSFGNVVYADPAVVKAVAAADAMTGTVINAEGRVVWERGIKTARSEISGIRAVDADNAHDPLQAAMAMVLAYKNNETPTSGFSTGRSSVYEWMSSAMKSVVLDLTGASLDEVLYYVYRGRPVIAMKKDGTACVITGYDAVSITVYEPAKKKSNKYSSREAGAMFAEAGNIFITYVD
ncbi:MAG: C39 family peptidase [Lachnospiraceae bacterium]|nr:C39 family peptidase [Lachnospiraceae bacterium]